MARCQSVRGSKIDTKSVNASKTIPALPAGRQAIGRQPLRDETRSSESQYLSLGVVMTD